jgi:threonine/homoserine/homoserine lactone efflux protein
MRAGLLSGLGAATADAAYACVAAFGLTAVSEFLQARQGPIRLVGGAFLAYLGVRTFLSRPGAGGSPDTPATLAGAYGSTFLLTLANPSTVVSFTLVLAALGLGSEPGFSAPLGMVLGVFLGSAAWWLILSFSVSLLRSRMDLAKMRVVNRVSGLALFVLGIVLLCRT